MSVLGIGLDLASVERIRRLVEGPLGTRFLHRCFTDEERAYCDARPARAESYAARWAAKEAFIKALGAPPGLRLREIEVVRAAGRPAFRLTGAAARELAQRRARAHLTLTHDSGLAAAAVVLETEP